MEDVKTRKKRSRSFRLRWRQREKMPVSPKMLVKALESLGETKLFGIYFTPPEVAQMISFKYQLVEQDFPLLLQEVRDKLICAAVADIVGFKIDSGYHSLTLKGESARIDTRSELTFWILYKKIKEERMLAEKWKTPAPGNK